MRKPLLVVATLLPFLVAGAVAAHHAAAGIVADDIYATIEENLADSPHLELDLTTIGSMTIVSVTVAEEDLAEVLAIVSDARAGQGSQNESSLEIDISPTTADGLVTIAIIERIGSGESQVP